jgi:hypothetical protein
MTVYARGYHDSDEFKCWLRRQQSKQLEIVFTCECGTQAGRIALQDWFDRVTTETEFAEYLDAVRWEGEGGKCL